MMSRRRGGNGVRGTWARIAAVGSGRQLWTFPHAGRPRIAKPRKPYHGRWNVAARNHAIHGDLRGETLAVADGSGRAFEVRAFFIRGKYVKSNDR